MKKKGFTLIEMLIVIAVIGVLAIAVLSAINPVEQMRKARDTRRKSNAAELLNALERYYATNEDYGTTYPAAVPDTDDCLTAVGGGNIGSADIQELVDADEVKGEFQDRITTADNYLYGGICGTACGGTELAIVCHQIESQANITKYTGLPNYCTDGTDHYICLPE